MILASLFLIAPVTWTLVAGGDIMLNGVSPNTKPFDAIKTITSSADFSIANLEIPLTNSTTPTKRKTAAEVAAKTQYILKADVNHWQNIRDSGFLAFGLANNHAMDYGPSGLQQTINLLNKAKVAIAGAGMSEEESYKPLTFVGKIKIGVLPFLAFQTPKALFKCWPSENGPGVAVCKNEIGWMKARVEQARKSGSTFVIAFLHWGEEKKQLPNIYQVSLGRKWIDAGADMVLGMHPHVLQGAELYRSKPVFYSLGDLVQPKSKGVALIRLTLTNKVLKKVEVMPFKNNAGKLVKQTWNTSFDKLSTLIQKNYPNKNSKLIKQGNL